MRKEMMTVTEMPKGVSVDKSSKKNPYRATLQLTTSTKGKVKISVGNFATPEEASKARTKYIKSLI